MLKQIIKYRYALNQLEEVICVDFLKRTEVDKSKQKFHCFSCGQELTPRLGKIRKKHFAHKGNPECSGETYLHYLGKEMFRKRFQHCKRNYLPFWVKFHERVVCKKGEFLNQVCEERTGEFTRINLIQEYPNIQVEQRDGSFVPDILLTSSAGKKIYFEIAVSHRSEKGKIESGEQIIELKLSSEDDLAILERNELDDHWNYVKTYNFDQMEIEKKDCNFSMCKSPEVIRRLISIQNLKQELEDKISVGSGFGLELSETQKCVRYKESFGLDCRFAKKRNFNLLRFYKSLEIQRKGKNAYLVLHDKKRENPILIWVDNWGEFDEKYPQEFASERQIRINSPERVDSIIKAQAFLDGKNSSCDHFLFPEGDIGINCERGNACIPRLDVFIVQPSGKSVLVSKPLQEIDFMQQRGIFFEILPISSESEYHGHQEDRKAENFRRGVIRAFSKGTKLKNCFLCRYHGENRSFEYDPRPVFCKTFKKACHSNEAVGCDRYRADESAFQYIVIELGVEYK